MHRDMHANSLSVSHTRAFTNTHTHIQLKKKKNMSQINTGKVQYVHVIYPKFMKQNEGRDHTGSKWKSMQKSTALL